MAIRKLTTTEPCGGTTVGYCAKGRRPNAGKPYHKHAPLKKTLDKFVDDLTVQKTTGLYLQEEFAQMTVRDYGAQWLAKKEHLRRGSVTRGQAALKRFEEFAKNGDSKMVAVTGDDIETWRNWLRKKYSASTTKTTYGWVRGMFKHAALNRHVSEDPCKHVKRPPAPKRKKVVPASIDEIIRASDQCPPHFRALVLVGAQTGLRPGELLGLCVEQVNFFARTITVDRQQLSDTRHVVNYTKTTDAEDHDDDQVDNVLPVDQMTLDIIAAHIARFGTLDVPIYDLDDKPVGEGQLIFHTHLKQSRPLSHCNAEDMWARACERAGVRSLRVHDLRHHFASVQIEEGCNMKELQALLRHKNMAETSDTYSHLFDAHQSRARARIAGAWHKATTSTSEQLDATSESQQ